VLGRVVAHDDGPLFDGRIKMLVKAAISTPDFRRDALPTDRIWMQSIDYKGHGKRLPNEPFNRVDREIRNNFPQHACDDARMTSVTGCNKQPVFDPATTTQRLQ
jgi:hypothetical protein